MIHTIDVDNVNEAMHKGLAYMLENGEHQSSRNGSVMVAPVPVCTTYHTPQRRVLFSPLRDANPFFHLMEAIWMLAGRNDVAWPAKFAKNMVNYSDDGKTFHGAYGYRWRRALGFDQPLAIINNLKRDPDNRRCVLQMWDGACATDAMDDLHMGDVGKDVPCNTHAYFEVRNGRLNMTVCNRSNDVIWGAYGANAVHFSMLQEFIALSVGVPMGVYNQFSNNYHIYLDKYPLEKIKALCDSAYRTDLYKFQGSNKLYPLMQGTPPELFLEQCEIFCNDPYEAMVGEDKFWVDVARPMYQAFEQRSVEIARTIKAEDWQHAAVEWLERRAK